MQDILHNRIRVLRGSIAFAILLALSLAGCNQAITETVTVTDPALVSYASSLAIDLTTFTKTSTGLYYKDVPAGTGTAADSGNTVTVDYTGRFTSGNLFDSSRGSANQTFSFLLGGGTVIAAWDQGIKGMRIGGKRRLIVPPSLGYGAVGSGAIPPNTILIFDITLYGVR